MVEQGSSSSNKQTSFMVGDINNRVVDEYVKTIVGRVEAFQPTRLRIDATKANILDTYHRAEETLTPFNTGYGLAGIKFSINSLYFHAVADDMTMGKIFPDEAQRYIDVPNIFSAAMADPVVELDLRTPAGVDLSSFDDQNFGPLLRACFSERVEVTAEEHFNVLMSSIILSSEEKARMERMGSVTEKLDYLTEKHGAKKFPCKYFSDRVAVLNVIDSCVIETNKVLQKRVLDFALVRGAMSGKNVVNTRTFHFTCTGTIPFEPKPNTRKVFYVSFPLRGATCLVRLSLRSGDLGKGPVPVELDVHCECMLTPQRILMLYSEAAFSSGLTFMPMADISKVQDVAWMYADANDCNDELYSETDYSLSNASTLVPLMTLAGLSVSTMDSQRPKEIWHLSMSTVISELCGSMGSFATPEERMHFVHCTSMTSAFASVCERAEDLPNLFVQVLLWAATSAGDVVDNMSDKKDFTWSTKQLDERPNKLGSQVMWVACKLLKPGSFSMVGYRYLADIIYYNMMYLGAPKVKVVGMASWLYGCLNSNTNFHKEDMALLHRLAVYGVDIPEDHTSSLSFENSVANKVKGVIEILNYHQSRLTHGDRQRCTSRLGAIAVVQTANTLKLSGEETTNRVKAGLKFVKDLSAELLGALPAGTKEFSDFEQVLSMLGPQVASDAEVIESHQQFSNL